MINVGLEAGKRSIENALDKLGISVELFWDGWHDPYSHEWDKQHV